MIQYTRDLHITIENLMASTYVHVLLYLFTFIYKDDRPINKIGF